VRREIGGTGSTLAYKVAVAADGSVYTAGFFNGTVDFGSGSLVASGNDYYLVKHDAAGNFQWVRREIGGTGTTSAFGLAVAADGSVYTAGLFNGTVDFGSGSLVSSSDDYFLVKHDAAGNFQWVRREIGGTGFARADGLAVAADGSVYTAGQFGGTVDFGSGSLVASGADYFLVKHDAAGNFQWVRREIGGTGTPDPKSVAVGPDGSVYTAGQFSGTVDFGSGSLISGSLDYFLVKHDAAGNFQWVRREIGGTGSTLAYEVAVAADGSVYTTGQFGGTIDFGSGSLVSSGIDYFLVKHDAAGNFQRVTREVAGAGNSRGYALALLSDGSIYLSGVFDSTVDFGSGILVASGSDYFLLKLTEQYLGSDIGTISDPFANIYTVGLLAQGVATFEDVTNVSGNILAAAPTLNTGYAVPIDAGGDRGLWTAIAINNQGYPFMTYRDATASPNRIRTAACSTADCSGSITYTLHDAGTDFTGFSGSSVAIRSDNRPIFMFANTTLNNWDPRIANCTNATCTSSTVYGPNPSASQVGTWPAIVIRPNGLPLGVSLLTSSVNLTQFYDCTTVDCSGTINAYSADSVDNGRLHTSMAIRANGMPFVTYYDGTNGDLRLINCTTSNCSASNAVALVTTNNVGQWSRAAVTKEGFPLIAHRNVTNQSVELVICKDYACGNFEQRVLVDTADNLGDLQLGLATKVDGSPVVSYYNTTNTSLYLYECNDPDCKTGINHRLTSSGDKGSYSSIARKMGTNDEFTIVYRDVTNTRPEVYNFAKSFTGGVSLGTASNYFKDLYVGKINTKLASISGFDVAEEYLVTDESIEAGEVVRFTASNQAGEGSENTSVATTNPTDSSTNTDAKLLIEKSSSAYDEGLIGVVSTEPGLYLSNWDKTEEQRKKTRPVALVGRVPVKVSSENGAIKRGDLLTSSEKYPGYAMKATKGGHVVGRSMEDFALEKGVVSMYVDLGFVPDEYYEGKGELGVELESAGAGDEELLKEKIYLDGMLSVIGKRAKFNVESLVVAGGMTVEGDLEVVGKLTTSSLRVKGLTTDKIEVSADSEPGLTGKFELPADKSELFIELPTIKDGDVVLLSVAGDSAVRVASVESGKGFSVKVLNNQTGESIKGSYLVIGSK
jgi:hypothetical protein